MLAESYEKETEDGMKKYWLPLNTSA